MAELHGCQRGFEDRRHLNQREMGELDWLEESVHHGDAASVGPGGNL